MQSVPRSTGREKGSLALPTDGGMAQRLPGAIMEEAQLAKFLTLQLTSQLLHDSSLGQEINLMSLIVGFYLLNVAFRRSYPIFFPLSFSIVDFLEQAEVYFEPKHRLAEGNENCRT